MYVRIEDLVFSYTPKTPVISHISLAVEEGEIIAILGSSGSGKSTLLRLLSGLEMPNQGNIIVNEETLCSNQVFIDAEKRHVGMVFQDYALFPHMSIEKNVGFGLKKMQKQARDKRIHEMLELVNMTDRKRSYPHELSGGQQQRIALARALAPSPNILLLDEPFSNLDADLKMKIRHELKAIIKMANMTSIFVTHDYDDAIDIADRIIYLEEGKIVHEERVDSKRKTIQH